MTISDSASSKPNRPTWFWIVAGLGLAWNVFGLVQFAGSLTSTPDSLMEAGMTAEQAAVMKGYPIWMTIAFAIGRWAERLVVASCFCVPSIRFPFFGSRLWRMLFSTLATTQKASSLLWDHRKSSSSLLLS